MKICPICNARCFDDMDTCFGCMHRFNVASHDDPFEVSEKELKIPLPHIHQSTQSKNNERRNQPRHAAPIKVDITSVQEKDQNPVIQAKYQLVISLEQI